MCLHRSKIGDNYGETCTECGETISGYGNFAEGSRHCQHGGWFKVEGGWQCMYCERFTKVDPEMDN